MKSLLVEDLALYTDFYQLTMAQGYLRYGKQQQIAAFDYYFRKLPYEGGYAVLAGIKDVVEGIASLSFNAAHLDYLRSQGFAEEFLTYLKTFRFTGTIHAMREGELVFPFEPIVRVEAPLIEAQVIETFLLNWLNFNTLVATKASRIRTVAGPDRVLLDMGLRRAQGFGSMAASQAALIGGFNASSNVLAGYLFDTPVGGTQAHAWVQSFEDELSAFRAFAETFPTNCTLLVDTYDTLASGVPNAIVVAKEMETRGQRMNAIRLDSGDLAYLAKRARAQLDAAGLHYVKIVATNDLDEYLIQSLLHQGAPVDVFGVGTKLATADGSPALGGVYKLVAVEGEPRIKVSENVVKISLPGLKQVVRYTSEEGLFLADGVQLLSEGTPNRIFNPLLPEKNAGMNPKAAEPLLHLVMKNGEIVTEMPDTKHSSAYRTTRLQKLAAEHQRLVNPHVYRVGISQELLDLRTSLLAKAKASVPSEKGNW